MLRRTKSNARRDAHVQAYHAHGALPRLVVPADDREDLTLCKEDFDFVVNPTDTDYYYNTSGPTPLPGQGAKGGKRKKAGEGEGDDPVASAV